MNQPPVEIKVLNIDHLGIIAGIIDEMELVEIVNQQIGIKEKEILSPGQEMKIQESEPESEMKAIELKHGYSRDHRPDLKQFIVDMICTGDGDVPLYLKIDSGNIDDKSVFVERLKEFKESWTFEGINVADSALYTKKNIIAMREMKWITRVPLSIKLAQEKISNIEDDQWTDSEISGYKMVEKSSDYGEIKQRWLIVRKRI